MLFGEVSLSIFNLPSLSVPRKGALLEIRPEIAFPTQVPITIFQGGAAHERERAWAEIRKRVFG